MNISHETKATLRQLEESLWIAETRFDRDYMDRICHQDFTEIGCSGRFYERDALLNISVDVIRAKLPLPNFKMRVIAEYVVQITYISEVQYDELQVCRRSSIWVQEDGQWQLWFHQGTPMSIP